MSLMTLPILPLELIVSYLDFSSLLSLANSHPSFAHLQPKEQLVIGEDFSVAGIRWQIRGLEHNPQHYLDIKIETRGLLGIKMVWEWIGLVCTSVCREFVLIKENLSERLITRDKILLGPNSGCSW